MIPQLLGYKSLDQGLDYVSGRVSLWEWQKWRSRLMKMVVELHTVQGGECASRDGTLEKWRREQFLFMKKDVLEFKSHCEVFMSTKESRIFFWRMVEGNKWGWVGGGDRLGRKWAEQLEIGIRRISMKSFRVSSEEKVERNSSLGCPQRPNSGTIFACLSLSMPLSGLRAKTYWWSLPLFYCLNRYLTSCCGTWPPFACVLTNT